MQSHELDKKLDDVRKSPQGLPSSNCVSRSDSFPDLGVFFIFLVSVKSNQIIYAECIYRN